MELVEDSLKQENLYDELNKDEMERQYQYEKGKILLCLFLLIFLEIFDSNLNKNNKIFDKEKVFFTKVTDNSNKILNKFKDEFSFSNIINKSEIYDNNSNNNNFDKEKEKEKDTKNYFEIINKKADELTNWLLNDYIESIRK
jgi:hypothetical protein